MKKFITFLLVICLILSLVAACSVATGDLGLFTANYRRQYNDFLRYSLGDFESVSSRWEYQGGSFTIGGRTRLFREWEIQFTRHNGEMRTLHFNNRNNIAEGVIGLARIIGESDIRNIVNYYFPPDGPTQISFWLSFRGIMWLDSSSILDPQTGLQLYSVTPQELLNDWDFIISTITVRSRQDVSEQFEAMMRTLSEYLAQDQVQFRFISVNANIDFRGFYDRLTDTFRRE